MEFSKKTNKIFLKCTVRSYNKGGVKRKKNSNATPHQCEKNLKLYIETQKPSKKPKQKFAKISLTGINQ